MRNASAHTTRRTFARASGKWVLAATILGSSMAFIDGTVVNVALPALQTNLNASLADVQWVIEAYALLLAAFLWLLYSQEQESPSPNAEQLAQLKKRINAHVKGLILAGDDGWNCCVQALETYGEAGEVFGPGFTDGI